MNTFDSSGSSREPPADPLGEAAKTHFNIAALFPYQRLVIQNLLDASGVTTTDPTADTDARSRQIVILPTGAGKSLCFMLPAFLIPGLTLVVFPLLALMADQLRRLNQAGLPAVQLKGGQSREERDRVWEKLRRGEARFLLSNPETLITSAVRSKLKDLPLAHTVVDEAHTVYEWGRSFRPAYKEMAALFQELNTRLLTAFTATASPEVLAGIREMVFPNRPAHLIMGNPDRENIVYKVVPSLSPDLDLARFLLPRLGDGRPNPEARPRPALVFCSSRISAEISARNLRQRSGEDQIHFYHAGLSREEKARLEEWFFHSSRGIFCVTCAFGMGVDKQNIRTVIHREPPTTVEAYLQEAGRAGRDRKPAEAILLRPWRLSPGENPPKLRKARLSSSESLNADPSFLSALAGRERAFREIFSGNTRCRREGYLALLGTTGEYCAGCDVCAKSVQESPQKLDEILLGLKDNLRRYNKRQLKFILAGVGSGQILRDKLYKAPFFSALFPWTADDAEALLEGLHTGGLLEYARKGKKASKLRFSPPGRHFMATHCHKKM